MALGLRTGADLECRARWGATVAAALDHAHMQEGIARTHRDTFYQTDRDQSTI